MMDGDNNAQDAFFYIIRCLLLYINRCNRNGFERFRSSRRKWINDAK